MKSRISSRQIAALGIGVCLFLLLVATVAVTKDSIAARDESSDAGVHTLDRSYGAWDYRAVQDANGELSVKINYDERSISGLRSFADANKKLADQLARQGGSVEVRITFRSFVDGDQFRSWVKTNGIRVSDSMLGAYDRKNYGISLGVSAQGQDALPQDAIERGISSLVKPGRPSAITPPLTVRGVYETFGTVESANLQAISSDPLVFIADVTSNIVRRDLTNERFTVPNQAMIVVDPPFGAMIHLGLENFQ